MLNHSVTYGNGAQPIRFVPIDRDGRPTRVSSATYSIVDLREPPDSSTYTVVASTSATLGSESTTLAAAAGPDTAQAKRLTVASETGFVEGRTYLLSAADGRRETFECVGIDTTSHYIYTRNEIRGSYPVTSSLVRAIELVGTFPSSHADDEDDVIEDGGGPFQVVWSYTIDDREYLTPGIIWVTRTSTLPWVTADMVLERCPTMAARARGRFTIEQAISAATRDICAELESSGKDPDNYRLRPSGSDAVCYRALWYLHSWCGTDPDKATAETWDELYKRTTNNWLIGPGEPKTVVIDPNSNERRRGLPEGGYFTDA